MVSPIAPIKEHVLYTSYADVLAICRPLDILGISGFIYMRRFPDGRLIDLSNRLDWSTQFLNGYFQGIYSESVIGDHMFVMPGVSLWVMNPENQIWQEGMQLFDYGNGISLCVSGKYYDEIFCFYGRLADTHLNDFYTGHIDLLMQFCDYFRDKARPLIEQGVRQPLRTPDVYLNLSQDAPPQEDRLKQFLHAIGGHASAASVVNQLTAQELNCIRGCALGKTASDIGLELHISKRTVESHLAAAKRKLGCATIGELIFRTASLLNPEI